MSEKLEKMRKELHDEEFKEDVRRWVEDYNVKLSYHELEKEGSFIQELAERYWKLTNGGDYHE